MRRADDAIPIQAGLDQRVARLAATQHGVFSRAQAMSLGATKGMLDHRVRGYRWERLGRNVFKLPGNPTSWRQSLMATCLAWGQWAAISHRAAAALWRLAGFDPGPVELTVPRNRKRLEPGIIHRHMLLRSEVTILEHIPVTRVERTLIDLTWVSPPELVEEAIDDALRRGIVSLPRLRRRLAELGRPGRPGLVTMRRLLDARDLGAAVPESVFERRLLRVLQRAGLPTPFLQHEVRDGDGLVGVVDFAFPAALLAIEADGYRWHSGRVRWDHDRARRNRLTLLGWRVIHVTWTDMTRDPARTTEAVRQALTLKG